MKKLLIIIIALGISYSGKAQVDIPAKVSKKNLTRNLSLGIGTRMSTFQDLKYSDTRYQGFGGLLSISYTKMTSKSFIELAFDLALSKEGADTHTRGQATVVSPIIYFKYLKPIGKRLKIGGRVDALDIYFRSTQGLGNNGNYILSGHNLFFSLHHNSKLNNNWTLISSADIGILSFMRESVGFAFSAPQNLLEDGRFNYQDDAVSSPFGYKYFDLKYLSNNLNLKSSFMLSYKNKLSIGYSWSIRHFANVRTLSTTAGAHNITIQYNLGKN